MTAATSDYSTEASGKDSAEDHQAPTPAEPSRQPRRVEVRDVFREVAAVWSAGVVDAISWHRCIIFWVKSEAIRTRTLQCAMLNGVIFLGSIVLFNWAIGPTLELMRHFMPEEEAWAADFIGAALSALYQVLWIYPIYCISFVLNTVMYQEVADHALALKKSTPTKSSPPLERLINEAFRVLLNTVYIIEMNLLYYIPVAGSSLYFLHSCWLASIYCFEYRWVHLRWTSNERLDYFEKHWLYFAGFGFPVSVVSFLCPRFIDAGMFAVLFPMCILTAIAAEPRALRLAPGVFRRLPVFAVVQGSSCLLLRLFEGRLGGAAGNGESKPSSRQDSGAATAASAGASAAAAVPASLG
eukprot:CAMPEP_0177323238 /NCGR_PEP_ID=MMETSP0368-20130122/16637_1 /TAXON_ID=447022 ORGANISM="Scrippsiella hangoei-like, Strain SHHI-4" /NCGR_SAMPLE_ID=MMETSP0368 /ASSEMBLY_ACC=CAM_ASM_000363 /LENGTH=353 /DNA_ID=CAMNT_0018782993 /DNA_START=89 /DNA_END=1150 /DNA_ORIENTATION=+